MARRVLILLAAAVLVYAGQLLPPLVMHDLDIATSLGEHFGWERPRLSPVLVGPPLAWAAVAAVPVLGRERRAAGISLTLLFFAPFAYLLATPAAWVAVRGVGAIGTLQDDPLLLGLFLPFVTGMILAPVIGSALLQWWLRRDARRRAAARATAAAPRVPHDPGHDAAGLPRH